ncbi:MAG: hypothetical protein IIA88_12450, partial [Bacteroidetes bacterium]|nr:hypothetical protein [Bacteroidota bacterium]
MHTRYINCLPLNSGFRRLLISSMLVTLLSCEVILENEIKNPGFVMSENEPIPKSWVLEGNEASVKKEGFEHNGYKPVLTGG